MYTRALDHDGAACVFVFDEDNAGDLLCEIEETARLNTTEARMYWAERIAEALNRQDAYERGSDKG